MESGICHDASRLQALTTKFSILAKACRPNATRVNPDLRCRSAIGATSVSRPCSLSLPHRLCALTTTSCSSWCQKMKTCGFYRHITSSSGTNTTVNFVQGGGDAFVLGNHQRVSKHLQSRNSPEIRSEREPSRHPTTIQGTDVFPLVISGDVEPRCTRDGRPVHSQAQRRCTVNVVNARGNKHRLLQHRPGLETKEQRTLVTASIEKLKKSEPNICRSTLHVKLSL